MGARGTNNNSPPPGCGPFDQPPATGPFDQPPDNNGNTTPSTSSSRPTITRVITSSIPTTTREPTRRTSTTSIPTSSQTSTPSISSIEDSTPTGAVSAPSNNENSSPGGSVWAVVGIAFAMLLIIIGTCVAYQITKSTRQKKLSQDGSFMTKIKNVARSKQNKKNGGVKSFNLITTTNNGAVERKIPFQKRKQDERASNDSSTSLIRHPPSDAQLQRTLKLQPVDNTNDNGQRNSFQMTPTLDAAPIMMAATITHQEVNSIASNETEKAPTIVAENISLPQEPEDAHEQTRPSNVFPLNIPVTTSAITGDSFGDTNGMNVYQEQSQQQQQQQQQQYQQQYRPPPQYIYQTADGTQMVTVPYEQQQPVYYYYYPQAS